MFAEYCFTLKTETRQNFTADKRYRILLLVLTKKYH